MFSVLAVSAVLRDDFETAGIAGIGLVLSFIPQLIVRRLRLKLPLAYEMVVLGFIVASIMLGELFDAYSQLWWWDSALHLSSGVIIGYIGYMILFVFHLRGKLKLSAGMVAFLTFSVSMMVAALWEVVEFTIDQVWGSTMQHGNTDTMKDIILAMGGSLVATAAAYWHYRWPDNSPLVEEMHKLVEENAHLVSKKERRKARV
jgi:hypothetical protein